VVVPGVNAVEELKQSAQQVEVAGGGRGAVDLLAVVALLVDDGDGLHTVAHRAPHVLLRHDLTQHRVQQSKSILMVLLGNRKLLPFQYLIRLNYVAQLKEENGVLQAALFLRLFGHHSHNGLGLILRREKVVEQTENAVAPLVQLSEHDTERLVLQGQVAAAQFEQVHALCVLEVSGSGH